MPNAEFQIEPAGAVVITLEPSEVDREALSVAGGVKPADFHVTLTLLDIEVDPRTGIPDMKMVSTIIGVMLAVANDTSPLVGEVSGMGFFGTEGFDGNTVALIGVDGLPELRQTLVTALRKKKVLVDEAYDFVPHIKLSDDPVPDPQMKVGRALLFERMGLRFGPQSILIPFVLPMRTATGEEVQIGEADTTAPAAAPGAPAAPSAAPAPARAPFIPRRFERPAQAPAPQAPAPSGPNVAAVEALMDKFVSEFERFARGAPIRAEGGRFGGSEPGDGEAPQSTGFLAGNKALPQQTVTTDQLNAVQSMLDSVNMNDQSVGVRPDEVAMEAFEPAAAATVVAVQMGAEGTFAFAGIDQDEDDGLGWTVGEVGVELGRTDGIDMGGSQALVGAGDFMEMTEFAEGELGMRMEIEVPAGHPVITVGGTYDNNLLTDGTSVANPAGGGVEPAPTEPVSMPLSPSGMREPTEPAGSTVILHPNTILERVTPSDRVRVLGKGQALGNALSVRYRASMPESFSVDGTEFARGEPIRGEGGRFGGSEPGDGPEDPIGGGAADPLGPTPRAGGNRKFADEDMAANLDPAGDWDNFDQGAGGFRDFETADASTVESVFDNGGVPTEVYTQVTSDGGMGMKPLAEIDEQYAEQAVDDINARMEELATPAPAEFTITTTANAAEYRFDPFTGNLVSPSGNEVEGGQLPFNSTPDNIVGYGNPTAALAAAAESGDIPVQITVSEGTPMINGGVGQVAPESAGTAVMLPGNAQVTVTGVIIDNATGGMMLRAVATPRG